MKIEEKKKKNSKNSKTKIQKGEWNRTEEKIF